MNTDKTLRETQEPRANRDPISGEPGSHPLGAGIGAVGGTLAGAALGAVAGPVGMVAGAIVGGFAGGFVGDQVGEEINPTAEDLYWQEAYKNEPYYRDGYTFDDYGPAYRLGYTARGKSGEQLWNEAQLASLRGEWELHRGRSRLTWEDAQLVTRAAWDRAGSSVR
jgi:hypothetical protein